LLHDLVGPLALRLDDHFDARSLHDERLLAAEHPLLDVRRHRSGTSTGGDEQDEQRRDGGQVAFHGSGSS